MSILALQASTVATEHPEGICHFVGFADDPEAPEKYLLLQRDLDGVEDSNDIPHLEWCEQSLSGYGLVESVVLGPDHLEVALSPEGVDLLGGATHVRVAFSIPAATLLQLQQSLSRIFHGTGGFHVAAA